MHSIINTELSSFEETHRQFNGGRCAIKMGVDVHQDFYVVVEQVGGTNPKPPQRFHKQAFLHWRQSSSKVEPKYTRFTKRAGLVSCCSGNLLLSGLFATWSVRRSWMSKTSG